jgi:hypothetical protein
MSSWSSVGASLVVVGLGIASLACGGMGGGGGDAWDGETTFVCAGSEHKRLEGQIVVITGEDLLAIEAAGSCVLEIVDCDITADFPLKAAGNAQVVIEGGKITGRKQSIQAWGNAVVTVDGATIVGETGLTGNGRIEGM